MGELEAAIEAGAPPTEVYALFGRCEFGFQLALEGWADNPVAAAGLAGARVSMARFELSQGNAQAAERLLAASGESAPDLLAQITVAADARAEDEAQLAAIRAREDLSAGARTRTRVFSLIALMGFVLPMIDLGVALRAPALQTDGVEVARAVAVLALLTGFWGAMRRAPQTVANRLLISCFVFIFAGQLAWTLTGYALGWGTTRTTWATCSPWPWASAS